VALAGESKRFYTRFWSAALRRVCAFNREYSRLFGQPPMQDIKALRTANVVAASVT
jgi:hypothetical protein